MSFTELGPSRGKYEEESSAIDLLVRRACDGEERAFELLVSRLRPIVYRWSLAYALDGDDADDITQETFVIAFRRMSQYRGDGAFHLWLYRVMRRAASQLGRTRRRRFTLARSVRALPTAEVYLTDPGGRVDRERLGAIVRAFWEELPERQRAVFDLVDLQGWSPAEAAGLLELDPGTLRTNLFKARRSVRTRLLARYPELGGATR